MQKRIQYFDILRVIAVIMVLINHTIAAEIVNMDNANVGTIVCTVSMVISRLGVPIFLMLTGALLLKKGRVISVKELYSRYILKLFIPFAVWTLIYYVLYDVIPQKNITLSGVASLLFHPGKAGHLWYMYVILLFYMIMPVFQSIVSKTEKSVVTYLIMFWMGTSGILHYLVELKVPGIPKFYVNPHIFNGLWGYLLLGWYLSTYEIKISRKLVVSGFLVVFLALSGVVGYQVIEKQRFDDSVISYSGIPVIIMAVAIFIIIKRMREIQGVKIRKGIHFLANISFAVYLNQFVARSVASVIVAQINIVGFTAIILSFVLTTLISVIMATCIYVLPDSKMFRIVKICMGIH